MNIRYDFQFQHFGQIVLGCNVLFIEKLKKVTFT